MIASEILDRLDNDPLRRLIRRHAAAYYLGAIAPDLKYYDVLGLGKFAHVSNQLHDLVETRDSGLIFKMLAKLESGSGTKDEIFAFILGYITHAVSDSVFHPMVYYFTGNLYDPDPRQSERSMNSHIRFETMLELFLFRSAGKSLLDFSPSLLCRAAPSSRRSIFSFFAGFLAKECNEDENELLSTLNRSYRLFLRLTSWFPKPYLYYLAKVANLLSIGRLQKYIGTFHPPYRRSPDPLFAGTIEFKHPFTGEAILTSVKMLNSKAVELGARCLSAAHETYLGGGYPEQLQALLGSKNMNTGTHIPASQLKYCSLSRF